MLPFNQQTDRKKYTLKRNERTIVSSKHCENVRFHWGNDTNSTFYRSAFVRQIMRFCCVARLSLKTMASISGNSFQTEQNDCIYDPFHHQQHHHLFTRFTSASVRKLFDCQFGNGLKHLFSSFTNAENQTNSRYSLPNCATITWIQNNLFVRTKCLHICAIRSC